jgi:glycosyltransferase involved in cell wall biosynthesis
LAVEEIKNMEQALIQEVRSNPNNKLVVNNFFYNYEASTEHCHDSDLTYLQLKCIWANQKWKYLNKISKIYNNTGKNKIAIMCCLASLVENPSQPAINKIVELAEARSDSVRAKVLRNNKLTVSVIMPTYNRTAEIRDSIQSVLRQSFKDFELIIVNDGGIDAVKKVVDSFQSVKIKYYKLDRNRGLAGALNEGLLKAGGRYIAYLDDDDVYYENHLGKLVDSIEKRSGCDLIYANAYWCFGEIRNGSFVEGSRKLLGRRPSRFDRELLFRRNYISTLNLIHKKECLIKCGFFNEDLPVCMDWELWMRFALEYNIQQINDITGEYRFKKNNMSTTDELSMAFFSKVISTYIWTDFGKIVLLKHYIQKKQVEESEAIINDLISRYNRLGLKTKKELFYLTRKIRHRESQSILVDMLGDYLKFKARSWIRSLLSVIRKRELYC